MPINVIICYIIVFTIMFFCLRFVFLMLGPMFTLTKKAPYVPSFNYHLRLMKKYLKLKKGAKLIDLGCGDGKALRFFTKNFGLKCEGYDINPFALKYGKIINRRKGFKNVKGNEIPQGGIKMTKARFEKANLKTYDYIYTYLFPNQLADIENRVFKTMGAHTIIISNSFKFAKHTPFDTIKNDKGKDSIFLYRK